MKSRYQSLTFLEAAKAVLEELKQPMHFKKITELAIQKKYLKTRGKTPEWTMGARLSVDVKEKGLHSEFLRTDNGKYGLRRWKKSLKSPALGVAPVDSKRKRFWLVAVEPNNFDADEKSGMLDTIGVKYRMRNTLAKLSPGDKIVIYIKKAAEFAAIMDVTGESYIDESQRWPVNGTVLSARIDVKKGLLLKSEARVDARQLYPSLAVFTQYPEKHRTLALRNGISEISESDFEIIRNTMKKKSR